MVALLVAPSRRVERNVSGEVKSNITVVMIKMTVKRVFIAYYMRLSVEKCLRFGDTNRLIVYLIVIPTKRAKASAWSVSCIKIMPYFVLR